MIRILCFCTTALALTITVASLPILSASPVMAQPPLFPAEQPNENRPPLPAYRSPAAPVLSLPPTMLPPQAPLSAQARVLVRRFQLSGNTVFSEQELAQVTRPYENRWITSEELQEVRHKLTLYYVERGYINSGAVIPDQQVTDGVVHITLIEGKLSAIEISGNDWLRTGYIQNRLTLDTDEALNIQNLQQNLQLLQQNPLLERLNAELMPGIQPGEGILKLAVQEAKPYEIGVIFANDQPPEIGAERVQIYALHRNLTGWGDSIGVYYNYGLEQNSKNNWSAFYAVPLNAYDTTLRLWYEKRYSEIIDFPFDLQITSKLKTYGIGLSHPFYRTPQQTFSMGLSAEQRDSTSYLEGEPFSFAAGADNGKSKVSVARFFQDWLDRDLHQVIAARSMFSWGLDAFGATHNHGPLPDGQYVGWLGQFQWARRLGDWGSQLLFRADTQLVNRSLLPTEQCSIGGMATVRGYRESQLVRDDCLIASLEWRIPVLALPIPGLSRGSEEGLVQLAPFVDYGRAWNKDLPTPLPKEIRSAGAGAAFGCESLHPGSGVLGPSLRPHRSDRFRPRLAGPWYRFLRTGGLSLLSNSGLQDRAVPPLSAGRPGSIIGGGGVQSHLFQ